MKFSGRFLAVILILGFVGGGIYLLGWVSLAVPADHFGIFYTKKSGYSLIADNKKWYPQRLIPFSTKIIAVPSGFSEVAYNAAGTLPNTGLFARLLFTSAGNTLPLDEIEQSFSYSLAGSFSFRLKPEGALAALKEGTMDAKAVGDYMASQQKLIENFIGNALAETAAAAPVLLEAPAQLASGLEADLNRHFGNMEIINFSISSATVPNSELYNLALNTTLAKAQAINQAQEAVELRRENEKAEQQERLRLLEEYGKLLTEYPILIQFFAVDEGKLLARDVLKDFMPAPHAPLSETPAAPPVPTAPAENAPPAPDAEENSAG
jgi:hypothetical protein